MPGRRQPQRIPPPIDHGPERLEAEAVLREFPNDLGLALWKTVRGVRLWANLPAEERATAFPAQAYQRRMELVGGLAADPELGRDLGELAEMLRGPMDPESVAQACARLHSWANERESPGTALEFAQAAAYASPRDSAHARAVARIALELGDFARAETWYRQALTISRQARDWQQFAAAFRGLGIVYTARGNYPLARKYAIRSLRVATRHSLRAQVAEANHQLTVLAMELKRGDTLRYARAAMEAYGPGHAWLPALGHDVANYWMSRGYFGPALEVFRRMPRELGTPAQRANGAANLARAAAAMGDMVAYREGVEWADRVLTDPRAQRRAAVPLLNLGRAALLLGDWELAQRHAERASQLARDTGEAAALLEIDAFIESIPSERRASSAASPVRKVPSGVEELAADLSLALRTVEAS
jgi:tetratricopeptide (TPR) repeat protein